MPLTLKHTTYHRYIRNFSIYNRKKSILSHPPLFEIFGQSNNREFNILSAVIYSKVNPLHNPNNNNKKTEAKRVPKNLKFRLEISYI